MVRGLNMLFLLIGFNLKFTTRPRKHSNQKYLTACWLFSICFYKSIWCLSPSCSVLLEILLCTTHLPGFLVFWFLFRFGQWGGSGRNRKDDRERFGVFVPTTHSSPGCTFGSGCVPFMSTAPVRNPTSRAPAPAGLQSHCSARLLRALGSGPWALHHARCFLCLPTHLYIVPSLNS